MGDAGLGLLVVNHLDLGLLLRPRPSSHCGPLYLLSLLLTRGHFKHLFVRSSVRWAHSVQDGVMSFPFVHQRGAVEWEGHITISTNCGRRKERRRAGPSSTCAFRERSVLKTGLLSL